MRPRWNPADLALTVARLIWLGVVLGFGFQVRAQVSPGPLSAAHAELDTSSRCRECHARGSAPIEQRCLKCHEEISFLVDGGLGLHGREKLTDCTSCHPEHGGRQFDLIEWDDDAAGSFDHDRAGWPLEGKHGQVKCRDCHIPRNQKGAVVELMKRKDPANSWLGLERECLACHEDRHQSTLGTDCSACHGAESWKPAARFDHDRSHFPLAGKHVDVECNKCHLVPGKILLVGAGGRRSPKYKPVPHAECSDCHQDPHSGRLGPACATCHVAASFTKVERERFDHQKTRYPLLGRHAQVDCRKCHDPVTAWGKRPRFETCGSCHVDVHGGTATLAGRSVDCEACHHERGFKPSTYTVVDHGASVYPLEGKHRQVSCDRCHTKHPVGAAGNAFGTAGVRLRPSYGKCRDCHEDSHGGQLASRPGGGACESCHEVESWKPSTYGVAEHAVLRVPLSGKHAQIKCAACHAQHREGLPPLPENVAAGRARVALTTIEPECTSCHFDPHDGRFGVSGERPKQRGCLHCHNDAAFRPATVDDEIHRQFDFALEGGHLAVPCVACHKELENRPSGVTLLRTSGSERKLPFASKQHDRCETCHENPHGEQFVRPTGLPRCDACHGSDAFSPASRFDHDTQAAFKLLGAHESAACRQCHPTVAGADGRQQVTYRPIPHECVDCHGKKGRDLAMRSAP